MFVSISLFFYGVCFFVTLFSNQSVYISRKDARFLADQRAMMSLFYETKMIVNPLDDFYYITFIQTFCGLLVSSTGALHRWIMGWRCSVKNKPQLSVWAEL